MFLYAFNDNLTLGARSAGIASSSVTFSDAWSLYHNQAGIANIENATIGVAYENRFLLPELGLKAGAVAIPTNSGTFGFSIISFGYKLYSESKYGLAYARKFGNNFSIGIQLDYLHTKIAENYGNRGAIAAEAGIQAKLTKELTLGAHIFNPSRAKLADYNDERIPTVMRLGLDYTFSEKVFVVTEIEKDMDYKPKIKVGIEYHIIEELYLRTGISSNPFLNAFGFGLVLKNFQLDIATSYHPVLGYSPQMSLTYNFK